MRTSFSTLIALTMLLAGCEDGVDVDNPLTNPLDGPPAGNQEGGCSIPAEAAPEDTSSPDQVVGDGTPESCTGDAFIEAVAAGGVITFDCGDEPHTITLDRPARVFNDTGPDIVIDGAGLITLSGGGTTRILYMNTCDEAQVWTTPMCNNQDHPRLTVQNLTFIDADSRGEGEYDGGGAIWVRGGRFKIVNSRFFNNVCHDTGPDVGGAAVRVFDQYEDQPVYVVNSTFGGDEGFGNTCSNGGGISSIGVSWTIINSLFSHNRAIGMGGNPAMDGTPGGGSGGAIYNDGNTMTLSLCGTLIEHNEVVQHGSAIFFVSNDHSGNIRIDRSTITNNVGGSWYPTYPQISNHDDTPIEVNRLPHRVRTPRGPGSGPPGAWPLEPGPAWYMLSGERMVKHSPRSLLLLVLVAATSLYVSACASSEGEDAGTGGLDAARRDSAVGDSGSGDSGPADAGELDAGDPCGGIMCEPFQYCDGEFCRDYPACRGDGTCDRPGDVCHARRCVPGDVDIDGDGAVAMDDCDETDPERYPGNDEECNSIDDDCDDIVDEGDPAAICEFYPGGGICIMGSCGCPPGTFDLDRTVAGCECVAMPAIDEGLDCATAIDLGTVSDAGEMMTISGNVMPDDRETWYRFRGTDTADTACDNYHVRVQFTTNPMDTFELTVYRGACDTVECGDMGFTDYEWATDLRMDIGGTLTGQCPCTDAMATQVADVSICEDDSADYFIRVRRRAGSTLACDPYTIEVSNGIYDTM